jgi:hypothetical protein
MSTEPNEHNMTAGQPNHTMLNTNSNTEGGASAPSRHKRKEVNRPRRGHRFYPSSQDLQRVPTLGATGDMPLEEVTIWLHYFIGACDWWVTEYDPETAVAFGYACLNNWVDSAEWGTFSLEELERLISPSGLPIERDCFWTPKKPGQANLPGWHYAQS